jgi:hypothetical protein
MSQTLCSSRSRPAFHKVDEDVGADHVRIVVVEPSELDLELGCERFPSIIQGQTKVPHEPKGALLTVRNFFGQLDALDDLVRSGGDGTLDGGVGVDTTKCRFQNGTLRHFVSVMVWDELGGIAEHSRFFTDVELLLKQLDQSKLNDDVSVSSVLSGRIKVQIEWFEKDSTIASVPF